MLLILFEPLRLTVLFYLWYETTIAAPVTNESPPTCKGLHDVHSLVFDRIADLCDPYTLEHLSCVQTQFKQRCTRNLNRLNTMAHIGDTPAFIPAIKRCFFNDDVRCSEEVFVYFQDQGKVKERHLAQLPALAAQMGAVKIFRMLNRSEKDRRWNKWMTRAALRRQYTFVKTFYGDDKIPSSALEDPDLASHDLHARVNLYSLSTLYPEAYTHYLTPEFRSLPMKSIFPPDHDSWLDKSLVQLLTAGPKNQLPSAVVKEILSILDMENSDEKQEKVAQFEQKIDKMLGSGIYLMDDLLPSPQIVISLWFNYYNTETPTSPNNEFLRFLLDEGAPINDNAFINTPVEFVVRRVPKFGSVYDSAQKMAIQYASGSGTMALANVLRSLTRVPAKVIRNFVERYVQFGNADVLSPLVLRQLIPYLTQFPDDEKTIEYFVNHGLHQKHLVKMYEAARVSTKQDSYVKTIDMLSKKIVEFT